MGTCDAMGLVGGERSQPQRVFNGLPLGGAGVGLIGSRVAQSKGGVELAERGPCCCREDVFWGESSAIAIPAKSPRLSTRDFSNVVSAMQLP